LSFEEFRASLSNAAPPSGLTPALGALWADGHGDWDGAHRIAQDIEGPTGAWVALPFSNGNWPTYRNNLPASWGASRRFTSGDVGGIRHKTPRAWGTIAQT
jgi:hypothetical protein